MADDAEHTSVLKPMFERCRTVFGVSRRPLIALGVLGAGGGLADAVVLALVVKISTALLTPDAVGANEFKIGILDFGHASVGLMLAIAATAIVVRTVLTVANMYLPIRLSAEGAVEVRERLLAGYFNATWAVQSATTQGETIDLLTMQTQYAAEYVMAVGQTVTAFLGFCVLAAAALAISPEAFGGILVVSAGLFFLLRPITGLGRKASAVMSEKTEQFAGQIESLVGLAEEARTFDAREPLERRAHLAIDDIKKSRIRMDFSYRLVWSTYQSLAMGILVLTLFILWLVPSLDLPSMGAVVLLLLRALNAGQAVQSGYHQIGQQAPFVDRVEAETARFLAGAEHFGDEPMRGPGQRVELRHVSFAYKPEAPVLSDVSLTLEPGELVAVIGPSGAGKSTLLQLLLRLREPVSGDILLDGQEIREIARSAWAERVSYVPQETRVLPASLGGNVRFFRELSDDRVDEAIRQSNFADVVQALPAGLQTVIGQRADALSGGQRQRLCIARALAGHPALLLLDEPTSALDRESEELIYDTLASLRGKVTTIVVAHRPGVLRVCDRVLEVRGHTVRSVDPAEAREELELSSRAG